MIAEVITGHPANNVTDSIFEKIGVNLHQQAAHPIGIIKSAIYEYFDTQHPALFAKFDDLAPVVSAKAVSSSAWSMGGAGLAQRLWRESHAPSQ